MDINDKNSENNGTIKNSFKDLNKNSEENILNMPKKLNLEKNREKLVVEYIFKRYIFCGILLL